MLDSKPEARDRRARAAHTCWDKAARPPPHMGPQSRGEPCRKSSMQEGWPITSKAPRRQMGGKENWPLEVAMGRPWEGKPFGMACVLTEHTEARPSPGGRRLQGRLEIYRKEALSSQNFFSKQHGMCVCLFQGMQEYKWDKLRPSLKPLPGERILGCQQGPWIPRSLESNSVPPPVQSKAEPPPSYGLISHQEKTLHMLGNWISLMWNTQYNFPLQCNYKN